MFAAEAETSVNPMIRMSMPSLPKTLAKHREGLAKLRLLRAGTGFLSTGILPVLPDPFGKNLLHVERSGKLKIWSVGSDGKDQGGKGGWSTTPEQTDMVLEITR
jgi:hypothetical protein